MNTSKKMAEIAAAALDEKMALDMNIIDISQVSTVADYFLVASGRNPNQVQAIADNVLERMGRAGYEPRQVEGYRTARWILLDFQDVVVHVFHEEDRDFYNIERVWRDGKFLDTDEILKKMNEQKPEA